jgi:hypothetical protein
MVTIMLSNSPKILGTDKNEVEKVLIDYYQNDDVSRVKMKLARWRTSKKYLNKKFQNKGAIQLVMAIFSHR